MGFVHFKQVRFFIFLWKFHFKSFLKGAFFVDLPTAFLLICLCTTVYTQNTTLRSVR